MCTMPIQAYVSIINIYPYNYYNTVMQAAICYHQFALASQLDMDSRSICIMGNGKAAKMVQIHEKKLL